MNQPSLFDPSPEPTTPAPDPDDWTELTWTHGRRYRWRLHFDRMDRTPQECTDAPGSWKFELEVLRGTWHEVRLFTRRDEIWQHVRSSVP